MKRQWIHLTNAIEVATQENYKAGYFITNHHMNALESQKADPFIDAMRAAYEPFNTNYNSAYNAWQSSGDTQQGDTLNVKQLLDLLSNTKIDQWDLMLQVVYNKKTAKYKAILPGGRYPFQHGGNLTRINSVMQLGLNIGSDAALATLRAQVDAFHTLALNAYNAQQQKLSDTTGSRSAVEAARLAMCTQQFADLGGLIQHYAATPDDAAMFFDLERIRNHEQVVFTNHIPGGAKQFIVKHTFVAGDMVRLNNMGHTSLTFYLAHGKTDAPGLPSYTVLPGTDVTVPVEELGIITNTFLNVVNIVADAVGQYEIDINA